MILKKKESVLKRWNKLGPNNTEVAVATIKWYDNYTVELASIAEDRMRKGEYPDGLFRDNS